MRGSLHYASRYGRDASVEMTFLFLGGTGMEG
jgi:hypothetical protein